MRYFTFNKEFTILLLCLFTVTISCQKKIDPEAATTTDNTSAPQTTTDDLFLYIASGVCYSGNGITTFSATTSSNQILKINTKTGARVDLIADYFAPPASGGDSPVGLVDWDAENLLTLVLNGTTGRIEYVPKIRGNRSNFGLTPGTATVIASTPRAMIKTSDGGLLILRTGFIEKVNSVGVRQGAPWVNSNLGATCGTANTLFTAVATSATTSNKIIATHAAASPNNRIASLPAAGANGSCLAEQASPQTTTFPTAIAFDHKLGKLIIAYAGSAKTVDINSIITYDFNETTGAISNPQKIYDLSMYPATFGYSLFGISALTLDETNSEIYVATAISTAATVVNYSIEKFKYDGSKIGTDNNNVLTKSTTSSFYNYGIDTKCISSMIVGK